MSDEEFQSILSELSDEADKTVGLMAFIVFIALLLLNAFGYVEVFKWMILPS